MNSEKPFIITIVGAESSGKTTIATLLANQFQCPLVPEYAREYLSSLGRDYQQHDLEIIAEKQWEIIKREVSDESLQPPDPLKGEKGRLAPNPLKGAFDNRQSFETSCNIIRSKIQNPQSQIIIDGGMLNLKLWAKIKYGITIPIVEEALENDVTDLYLLCRPRNEWVADPLREAPTILERAWIYNQYLEEIAKCRVDLEIIAC